MTRPADPFRTRRRLGRALESLRSGRFDLLLHGFSSVLGLPPFLPRLPLALNVEPTNQCNLSCPLCPVGGGRNLRPPRFMEPAQFETLVIGAQGRIPAMVLHNDGEPLLHPELPQMIRLAADAGIRVELSTNGMLLASGRLAQELVASGLRRLVVSLDGGDQETLARYRRGAEFERITEGVRLLARARRKLGSPWPVIEVQCLLLRTNEDQRGTMPRLARGLGADLLTEKSAALMDLPLCDPATELLAAEFLPSDPSDSRYVVDEAGRLTLKGDPSALCRGIHTRMVVLADGTVVPCCCDHHAEHPMGNAFTEPLGDIWRGARFRTFRDSVRRSRPGLPLCRDCPEGRIQVVRRRVLFRGHW
jgi:radical SAM protein with 4Fe4S-binding SPASM domain